MVRIHPAFPYRLLKLLAYEIRVLTSRGNCRLRGTTEGPQDGFQGKVRLFEAFVSYKQAGVKSDHRREAGLLREVVRGSKSRPVQIVPAEQLKELDDDELISAFRVIGMDCGVPAVIML